MLGMTRFAEVASASDAAVATRSRSAKVAAFAELLRRLEAAEIVPVVAWLSGRARQGRIGIGWSTVGGVEIEPVAEASLEVSDVDDAFAAMAAASGAGSTTARKATLSGLLARATASEADLLRRLLLGEIRQGALESLVADAVARAAGVPAAAIRRGAMLAGDLPSVAVDALTATDPHAALAAVGLTVGRPVQPMLAATATSVGEALTFTGEASVEWKLDGARIQAHKDGDDVRLFTRNLNDVTNRLPGIVDMVRSLPVRSAVLDGEAIGVAESQRPEVFQDTMARFGRHDGEGGAGLVARFFDVLHVDGTDVLDRPLHERLSILDGVVGAAAIPRLVTSDAAAATAFADDALGRGHEGVMVKALDSTYDAGRRGGAWRKVKPVRTLDLVVLGVEWGSGRRKGWLSNLHLGARATDPADGFVMVGKTFKGLTDALLEWQTAELLAREERREGHVVFVRPELVVEIALDGAQRSTRYPGGVALRFARVRRYRDDKGPDDIDTIDAVRALSG
jgi:DNA ligase-1